MELREMAERAVNEVRAVLTALTPTQLRGWLMRFLLQSASPATVWVERDS